MNPLIFVGTAAIVSGVMAGAAFAGGNILFGVFLLYGGSLLPSPLRFPEISTLVAIQTAFTSVAALCGYRSELGRAVIRRVFPMAMAAWFTALATGWAAGIFPEKLLLALLGFLAMAAGYFIAYPHHVPNFYGAWRTVFGLGVGVGVGFFGGLLGIGGGFLLIPVLEHSALPLRQALGGGFVISLGISLIALLSRTPVLLRHAGIDAVALGGSFLGAYIGSAIGRYVSHTFLRRLVILGTLVSAIRIWVSLW